MARFLVKMNAITGNALASARESAASGFTLTRLMPHSQTLGAGFGFGQSEDWFLATTDGEVDPGDAWDECHARTNAFGAAAHGLTYVEPDILQPFITNDGALPQAVALDGALVPPREEYWMADAGIPHGRNFDWHLEDLYSGLRSARNSIQTPPDRWRVRIGHLDTGYTDDHQLLPVRLDRQLQRSFVSGDNAQSAIDPFKMGFMKNPGHGTGTLCLLAGGRLSNLCFPDENRADGDFLGGAPHATVVPVRIAASVVLMYTSGFAQGLDYLLAPNGDPSQRVDVVSMSMGGVSSAAWTDIVNRTYDGGVILCTAAGNHFGELPPSSIVYPARYRRVIAVCGVMQDGRPYADLPARIMCGCYGPQSKMSTTMAAYSPNLPWALYNSPKAFRWDGEGTSAATPQVAAAAALYIEAHYDEFNKLPYSWERVEAVRNALFTAAASKSGGKIDARLGNGVLDANATLRMPVSVAGRQREEPDSAFFPFLRVLTGLGVDQQPTTAEMLNVEIVQLTQQYADLQRIIPDPEAVKPNSQDPEEVKQINDFLSAITTIPSASKHLKAALSNRLRTRSVTVPEHSIPALSRWAPPKPPCRKLQGYVFDPSMSTQLQYVSLSETTYKIRWESDLRPGPIGEYLEVIDTEAPLDLNVDYILAQDGLEPSETSPQFRQQMLYAVGMKTLDVFESALGRLVNWAPDEVQGADGKPKKIFRQRLKLYPHGIQAPNAFYSPPDGAIYFGYFKATDLTGTVYPGMVYAALSHDIIAHEMTHALLDGIHRAFREPSNPDVLAFHEAFADIVALLQQFGNIDVVRSQSAAVRGDLSMESLLGNLARQFGEATKGRSALRSAYLVFNKEGIANPIEPDPKKLKAATEAHDRGAILVAAVYGAFLSIYRNRTVDFYRIASDGKSETALHLLAPDLVNRLALEASRAARHVLKMCIRAIDYLPPVDITFGDFLRAVVTADLDVVPDDPLHYRVAFIESFRRWRIYPEGLETLSSESLAYSPIDLSTKRSTSSPAKSSDRDIEVSAPQRTPNLAPTLAHSRLATTVQITDDSEGPLKPVFTLLRKFAGQQSVASDRKELFERNTKASDDLHDAIRQIVTSGVATDVTLALGLEPNLDFEVTRLRFSHKTSPAGSPRPRVLVSICQKDGIDAAGLPIRWGVTLIVDLVTNNVLYRIPKLRTDTDRPSRKGVQINSASFSRFALDQPFMLLHQS